MASYSVSTTALALGVPRKRVENLLLRCSIPGVSQGRQGRSHRLSRPAVLAIALILELQDRLAIPAPFAARLIAGLLADTLPARTVALGPITLTVDFPELERRVATAIAAAVEIAPRPRRGRPMGSKKNGGRLSAPPGP